jgi:hypothetical protein
MAEASFGNTTIPRLATPPAAPSSHPPNRLHSASAGAVHKRPHSAAVPEARNVDKIARCPSTARALASDIVKSHRHLINRLASLPASCLAAGNCPPIAIVSTRVDASTSW